MKRHLLYFILLFTTASFSQTLLNTYEFPRFNSYNSFWGITEINDTLWVGSDYNSTSGVYQYSWMYKVSKEGQILDSIQTAGLTANHGMGWDGMNFWIADQFRTAGAKVFKYSPSGVKLDSIVFGSSMAGIGDIFLENNTFWFSVYSPDYLTYPHAYAYHLDIATQNIIDTIPLRGRQVYGIAVKGDTIFYVNDDLHGEVEKIYAYSKVTGDTVMSWPVPDPDGNMSPRGLHWDGQYLWLIGERVGPTTFPYKALYKYDIFGEGTPIITTINSISFGDVIVGQPKNINLNVSNTGDGKLIIDSLIINNILFSISPNQTPDTILPGQFKNYSVQFAPQQFGDEIDELKIYSNAGATPVKNVALSGRGVFGGPIINISPASIHYGDKRKGSTSYKEITLTNYGAEPLNIDSLSLRTLNFYPEQIMPPITLDSVESTTFRVWFNPVEYGAYTDTLTIFSNASNGSQMNVFLQGTGSYYDSTLGAVMWDYIPASSAQIDAMYKIEDITKDGIDDFVAYGQYFGLFALNGNSSGSADLLWRFPRNMRIDYYHNMQVVADLDGDGFQDIVFGGSAGAGMAYAVNGVTGELIWSFGDSTNFNNGAIMGVDGKRDFSGDGIPDILISASGSDQSFSGRYSVFCVNGATGEQIFRIDQSAERKLKYNITSLDNGGAAGSRSASSTSTGEVLGFDKQGNLAWAFPTLGTPWEVVEIDDLDGDENSDIICGTTTGRIYAISSDAGIEIWATNIGNSFITEIKIVDDIDEDRIQDIFVSGINPNVYLLSGRTGQVIWQQNTGGNVLSKAVLGDLNADGLPELATGSLTVNKVDVFDGKEGTSLFSYPFGSGGSNPVDGLTVLGDLDKNGTLEFAAGTRGGRVTAFSGGTDVLVSVDFADLIPTKFKLEQNYPNPFNPTTVISYAVPQNSHIKLTIFDILGREINTLINQEQTTGNYQIIWDGTNYLNKKVSTGVYFYRLETKDFAATKKMILMK